MRRRFASLHPVPEVRLRRWRMEDMAQVSLMTDFGDERTMVIYVLEVR